MENSISFDKIDDAESDDDWFYESIRRYKLVKVN